MNKNVKLLKRGLELLIFGAITGILVAGCGGGSSVSGNSAPAAAVTPVASYIANGQGTGFNGWWANTNGLVGYPSAVGETHTLAATVSAGTYTYTITPKNLANGAWANAAPAPANYNLLTLGWTPATGSNTFVDGGDGLHASLNNSNGASVPYSFAQTNLAGAPITCYSPAGVAVACAKPGNYPPGASAYLMTQTAASYTLTPYAITNASGVAMTALPSINVDTFCDPYLFYVYQPTATPGTDNVYSAAGCSSANITAAVAPANLLGTVQMIYLAYGNAAMPTYVSLSGWTGAVAGWNIPAYNNIYALRGATAYSGWGNGVGYMNVDENKTAINAELTASGFAPMP